MAPCAHFQKLDVGINNLFSNLDLGTFSLFSWALFMVKFSNKVFKIQKICKLTKKRQKRRRKKLFLIFNFRIFFMYAVAPKTAQE